MEMSNLRCVVSAVGGATASLRLPRRPAAKLGKRTGWMPFTVQEKSLECEGGLTIRTWQVLSLTATYSYCGKFTTSNPKAMDDPANTSQLRILQRQYFQLVEPSRLTWPDDTTLKTPDVQSWLFSNLFDMANITSPPPGRYQLRILKEVIAKLERSISDPEEDVWSPISSFWLPFSPCLTMYFIKFT